MLWIPISIIRDEIDYYKDDKFKTKFIIMLKRIITTDIIKYRDGYDKIFNTFYII